MSEENKSEKKETIGINKKKTEKEKQLQRKLEEKERDKEADVRARAKIREKQLLEEKLKEKKKKRYSIKTRNKKNYYIVKVYYVVEKYSGTKEYLYQGEKEKKRFSILEVGNKVQYINENHPNHLKKAIVRKHVKSGGTLSNPRVEFEIIFNDPPFLWEKNDRTGEKYKTKKKIKVIEGVNFKNLRKLENLSDFKIMVKNTSKYDDTFNIRYLLDSPIKNEKNNIVQFYKMIIHIVNNLSLKPEKHTDTSEIKDSRELEKIVENEKKLAQNTIDENNKKVKDYLARVQNSKNEKFVYIILSKISGSKAKEVKLVDNNRIIELIYHFNLFFNLKLNDCLTLLDDSSRENNLGINIDRAIRLFDLLLEQTYLNKDKFLIKNKVQLVRFVKNILKRSDELYDMKLITYEERFNKEIKNLLRKKFLKKMRFYPQEVYIKHTNKTEEKKLLFDDPNKLVEPTGDRVFTIHSYNVMDLMQPNDYINREDGKKEMKLKKFILEKLPTENSPGEIKIKLEVKLNMETIITPEELLRESKTKTTARLLGDVVRNFQNNLNCSVSKEKIKKDIKDIGTMFYNSITPITKIDESGKVIEEEPEKVETTIRTEKLTPNVTVHKKKVEYLGGNKRRTLKKPKKHSKNYNRHNKSVKIRKI